MLAAVRESLRVAGTLWTSLGQVLRARWQTLLLLFMTGWAGYYLTILITGLVAPRWGWAVIPLMGAGCLIQLVVTLAAYRLVIRQAGVSLGHPLLPPLTLIALVAGLLVPFTGAYSVFGYFEQYARDAMRATAAMRGSFAYTTFLTQVDPFKSILTLIVTLSAFVAMWVGVRIIDDRTEENSSPVATLVRAFLSACMTFLVLFSLFRVVNQASVWLANRNLMSWLDQAGAWLQSHMAIQVPTFLVTAWHWLAGAAWPVFWSGLCQPIVWLAVVALVGGMQFKGATDLWYVLRSKLGFRGEDRVEAVLDKAPEFIIDPIEGALRFLHMLAVVLKSGVPFLGALIVSFNLVDQVGTWATYLIAKAAGPIAPGYSLLFDPLLKLVALVVIPLVKAVLLAVAYVYLRHQDAQWALARPQRPPAKSILALLISLVLAIGITQLNPGSLDQEKPMRAGQPVVIAGASVVVDDLRIGLALSGTILDAQDDQPVTSQGVFVAVHVTLASRDGATMKVVAQVGTSTHPTWHNDVSIHCDAGFSCGQDLVFELALDDVAAFSIRISPGLLMSEADRVFEARTGEMGDQILRIATDLYSDSVVTVGVFAPASAQVVASQIVVDETTIEEVM